MLAIAARVTACVFLLTGLAVLPAAATPLIVTNVSVNLPETITLTGPVEVTAYVGQIVLTTTLGVLDV